MVNNPKMPSEQPRMLPEKVHSADGNNELTYHTVNQELLLPKPIGLK